MGDAPLQDKRFELLPLARHCFIFHKLEKRLDITRLVKRNAHNQPFPLLVHHPDMGQEVFEIRSDLFNRACLAADGDPVSVSVIVLQKNWSSNALHLALADNGDSVRERLRLFH